jgi:excisionase family DNA binding protein
MPPTAAPEGPPVLTIEEAAARLRLSKRAFRLHVQPNVPTVKVGRRILVPVDALDGFVRERAALRPVGSVEPGP